MQSSWAWILAVLPLMAALPAQRAPQDPAAIWDYLSRQYDADRDGRITPAEHGRGEQAFANLDRNRDGVITREDLAVTVRRPGAGTRGAARPTRREELALPKVGDVAPDFELPRLAPPEVVAPEPATPATPATSDAKPDARADARADATPDAKPQPTPQPQLVKLSSFAGKRPVALIFGSYT